MLFLILNYNCFIYFLFFNKKVNFKVSTSEELRYLSNKIICNEGL